MKIMTIKLVRNDDANFAYILRVIANDIEDGKKESKYANTIWRIF